MLQNRNCSMKNKGNKWKQEQETKENLTTKKCIQDLPFPRLTPRSSKICKNSPLREKVWTLPMIAHCLFISFLKSSLCSFKWELFPCKSRAQEWVGIDPPLWPNPFPIFKKIKRLFLCYNYMSFKAQRAVTGGEADVRPLVVSSCAKTSLVFLKFIPPNFLGMFCIMRNWYGNIQI